MTSYYSDTDTPSPSERYTLNNEIRAAWTLIPKRVQIGFGRFRDAWIVAKRDGATADEMGAALKRYYASAKGRGQFARHPFTFIHDCGWMESPEAWGDGKEDSTTPAGPAPKIDWTGCKPLREYRHDV